MHASHTHIYLPIYPPPPLRYRTPCPELRRLPLRYSAPRRVRLVRGSGTSVHKRGRRGEVLEMGSGGSIYSIYTYVHICMYASHTHIYLSICLSVGLLGLTLNPSTSVHKRGRWGQSIKGPHKATHAHGEATSQHYHRGQQTLRHEVTQAWGL